LAEPIAARMGILDAEAMAIVMAELEIRPERWRPIVRLLVQSESSESRSEACRALDKIGEPEDVALLRKAARTGRRSKVDPSLGRGLARRLAHRVVIEDLGRVVIRVGPNEIPGSSIRRKVLALLCLLLTRTGFAAARDEVIDALWPDMDPGAGLNSLNQTVYFLRRVFEPEYDEDLSPGYLHHESEILWIDRDLFSARSQRCAMLISQSDGDFTRSSVDELSEAYIGRFALDFMYEEWGAEFRDNLHVGYLQVVETAIAGDIEAGAYAHGISLARRALAVEPGLESLERSLLRLFKLTGAHSAAAEQYAHYATLLREETGIEPPPIEAL
jgi:DNA-binding SARP family transcriptional activator